MKICQGQENDDEFERFPSEISADKYPAKYLLSNLQVRHLTCKLKTSKVTQTLKFAPLSLSRIQKTF